MRLADNGLVRIARLTRRGRRLAPCAWPTAAVLLALAVMGWMPLTRQDTAVRVLVFNIHAGRDSSGRTNLEAVAELIRSVTADIVLVQELDRGTRRSGHVDQLKVLSDRTGFDGAFGRSLDYDDGQYGIAALARRGLASAKTLPLPVVPPQPRAGGTVEPRVALGAIASTAVGALHVMTTHLDASKVDDYRLQETARLLDAVRHRSSDIPLVIGGDFNAEPGSRVYERLLASGLRDAWIECGRGEGLTYPSDTPIKRIDYLFLTGSLSCANATVIDTRISDHRPLLVTIGGPQRERSGDSPESRDGVDPGTWETGDRKINSLNRKMAGRDVVRPRGCPDRGMTEAAPSIQPREAVDGPESDSRSSGGSLRPNL